MFKKSDRKLEETAADPAERQKRIEQLGKTRPILIVTAVVLSSVILAIGFFASMSRLPEPPAAVALVLVVVFNLYNCARMDAEMKYLQLIHRFEGNRPPGG
jgi:hypothetical protein